MYLVSLERARVVLYDGMKIIDRPRGLGGKIRLQNSENSWISESMDERELVLAKVVKA